MEPEYGKCLLEWSIVQVQKSFLLVFCFFPSASSFSALKLPESPKLFSLWWEMKENTLARCCRFNSRCQPVTCFLRLLDKSVAHACSLSFTRSKVFLHFDPSFQWVRLHRTRSFSDWDTNIHTLKHVTCIVCTELCKGLAAVVHSLSRPCCQVAAY